MSLNNAPRSISPKASIQANSPKLLFVMLCVEKRAGTSRKPCPRSSGPPPGWLVGSDTSRLDTLGSQSSPNYHQGMMRGGNTRCSRETSSMPILRPPSSVSPEPPCSWKIKSFYSLSTTTVYTLAQEVKTHSTFTL